MLTCQNHLFSLPDELHYLNCAYMAPLSRPVEEAGLAGIRRKRVPVEITADDFFREADHVRQLFASLVNVSDPRRIAIVPSVSYGMAAIAKNTRLRPGQNVVVAAGQFPSNVYAWQRIVQEAGAELRTVAPPDHLNGRGRTWNERLVEAIDTGTALVALGHVHWADGTRFALEDIGARARAVGAALVVDGTQSVGALPFDAARIQPDALVCAGYKWLLGPYGIGLAYFGPRYDGGIPLEENWITRAGSERFSDLVNYQRGYQPVAIRYDMGERSNFILLPMLIAALGHLHEWGVEHIQRYCTNLTGDLLKDASDLGFQVEEAAWRGAHLFGLRVPRHVPMERLTDALQALQVSASIRGDAVRISPHVYNDDGDIAALREALHACTTTPVE